MRILRLLLLLVIFSQVSHAQTVISTSGEEFSHTSGKLSWTLGEPVIETFSTASFKLTQGFQQDYQNILSVAEPIYLQHLTAYPNPVNDFLTISSEEDLFIQVYSSDAKKIDLPIHNLGENYVITTSGISAGIYYLSVRKGQQTLEIKFIKL